MILNKKKFLIDISVRVFFASVCCINFSLDALASSDSGEDTDLKEKQSRYLSSYQHADFRSSLSQKSAAIALGNLGVEELPTPPIGHIYVKDKATGRNILKQKGAPLPGSLLTVYPTTFSDVNYLAPQTYESFAHTCTKTYKGSRKYPMNPYQLRYKLEDGTVLAFDRGHGIDHADGDQASSSALANYTPQVSFYNRHIRNPLVARIRDKEGSYKETAIYSDHPDDAGNGTHVPIGFIFQESDQHTLSHTYYFPNLINYKTVKDDSSHVLEGYEAFCDFFEINDQGVFKSFVVTEGGVVDHLRAVVDHSAQGYRILSGRINVISEDHGGIPRSAAVALHKMLAIRHLYQIS